MARVSPYAPSEVLVTRMLPEGTDMSAIPQDREDILGKRSIAHVATIGPSGEPQSNPVWIDWDGQYVKFSQTTTRQKVRNLRREPRIALSVHDPDEPHCYLEVRGKVVRVENDEGYAFINKMAQKYTNVNEYPAQPGEERIILRRRQVTSDQA